MDASAANLIGTSEAAGRLGVSARTVRRAIARGEIPALRRNGAYCIAPAALEQFRSQAGVMPHLSPIVPQPVDSFVGRQRELAMARSLLLDEGVRLLTLTGPGGVGKTRLAIAIAERIADTFADGVAFVDLAALTDAVHVAPAIAASLGISEAGDRPMETAIVAHLQLRHLLLVIDNAEHLLPVMPLLYRLLDQCPRLAVLVTSRSPLRLSGEHRLVVPPLPAPELSPCPHDRGGGTARFDGGTSIPRESEAVTLFFARAQAVRPDLVATPGNASAVAELCRRLDCLPLAIELAAAHCATFTPGELLGLLEERLGWLTDGPRNVAERHRSLRNTIAWSHGLLSPDERAALRRLAVFAGGFDYAAAVAVIAGNERQQRQPPLSKGASARTILESLVTQNLLTCREAGEGTSRYGMLDTIREFALEQLAASGEETAVRSLHAELVLHRAEDVNRVVPQQYGWWRRFSDDWDNFRAAFAWSAASGETGFGLRLGAALFGYWMLRGQVSEGIAWLERLVAAGETERADVRGRANWALASLLWFAGDLVRAEALADAGILLCEREEDAVGAAANRFLKAFLAEASGDLTAAAVLQEDARNRYEQLGVPVLEASAAAHLARVLYRLGEGDRANLLLQRAVPLLDSAASGTWAAATAYGDLALVTADAGDLPRAAAFALQSLERHQAVGDRMVILLGLTAAARIVAEGGDAVSAARLLGGALTLRVHAGPSLWAVARLAFERARTLVTNLLGEPAATKHVDDGQALTTDAATAEAVIALQDVITGAAIYGGDTASAVDQLSTREIAVLRLVAAGLTDREIALELRLGARTVNTHVANIRRKLGVSSRAAAVAVSSHRIANVTERTGWLGCDGGRFPPYAEGGPPLSE